MDKNLSKEEIANDVKIFIEKHCLDRNRVVIDDKDYQFKLGEISDVEIDLNSINDMQGYYQINFNCLHSRYATGVTTSYVQAYVQAHAFFVKDNKNEIVLTNVILTNIKDKY